MENNAVKHTILFVDDEINILNSLKRLFRREGYNILAANSGVEAIEYFKENNISLVISDQRMPEMTGVEVLAKVKKLSPDTIRIMLTGYADINAVVAAINKGEVYRFIAKPWNDEDIKLLVKHSLQQLDLQKENKRLTELTNRQNEELKTFNNSLEQKVQERTAEVQKLYGELKKGFFETIRVMVGLMELLNPPLGGHSKRVAAMSKDVAKRMGLGQNEASLIEVSALLHDIGLMGIPSSILSKGMKAMNEREQDIYKQHPVIGHATLNMIKELRQVAVIVKSHHERFDGKGFPSCLAGDEIPLGSRIIAVADAYDEIATSKEFFSEKSSKPEALNHLKKFTGFKFDPEVVEFFLQALDKSKDVVESEEEILLGELSPGMVIARDVFTQGGRLLLAKNNIVEGPHLEKIKAFNEVDSIQGNIVVYKRA